MIGNPNRILITGDSLASGTGSSTSWVKLLSQEIGNSFYFVGEWGRDNGTTATSEMTHESRLYDLGYTWDGFGNSGHSAWGGTAAAHVITDRNILTRVEDEGIIEKWFPNPTTRTGDLVIMEVGTNDVTTFGETAAFTVTNGFDPFVTHVKSVSANITTVILSPALYSNPGNATLETRWNNNLNDLNDALVTFAGAEDDVEYIDIRTSLESCWTAWADGTCTSDGLHPNNSGAILMYNSVLSGLQRLGLID